MTETSHTEFRIFGPPGTGKTTRLSHEIGRAAERYGPDQVLVASFTKAAAAELVSRDLPVDRGHVGTLHALCYRQLGRPEIADTHLDEWNAVAPAGLRLTFREPKKRPTKEERQEKSERLVEAAPEDRGHHDPDMPTIKALGDDLFSQYQIYRAQMRPRLSWPTAVAHFATQFERWKTERAYLDFTDLIEQAYLQRLPPPGNPTVGFYDEFQDFTALEAALVRRWGEGMSYIVMSGDDDQLLYRFKGATPDSFLTPIPEENVRILGQSYRVPAAVHAVAMRWVERIGRRRNKPYAPRDAPGEVRQAVASWRHPDGLIGDIDRQLGEGRSVMILAACSYQLAPTIMALKAAGLPFANRYRRTNGAWNPLRPERGVSMAQRILAYLRPDIGTWGTQARLWTGADLAKWADLLNHEGVIKHGQKKVLLALSGNEEIAIPDLDQWFEDAGAIFDAMDDPRLVWLEQHIMGSKAQGAAFPIQIVRRRGGQSLMEEPAITVGTIHSVKGGEADCSPGDEPVLTTNRGWVNIADLDPDNDWLVSFNSDHHKIHRGGPRRPNGYRFIKGQRSYEGPLLTITTDQSRTRVTPNHLVTVRWAPKAAGAWAVYLMRRGDWWRIGITKLNHQPRQQSGITMRLNREGASQAWILGLFDSQRAALYYETSWSQMFHVPDLTFEVHTRNANQLDSADLHTIWNRLDSKTGALALLAGRGLSPEWPMWDGRKDGQIRRRQTSTRNRWTTRACNLIPKYMEIPTDPGHGLEPVWLPIDVEVGHYKGEVYSLDVERWHHYVSGGAVIHNCVYVYPDISAAGAAEWETPEGRDAIRRQFYVALTRARETLVIAAPAGGGALALL